MSDPFQPPPTPLVPAPAPPADPSPPLPNPVPPVAATSWFGGKEPALLILAGIITIVCSTALAWAGHPIPPYFETIGVGAIVGGGALSVPKGA